MGLEAEVAVGEEWAASEATQVDAAVASESKVWVEVRVERVVLAAADVMPSAWPSQAQQV